jgi:hypothetical protein
LKSKILQWLAILLLIEVGLVHYFSAQHEFEEAALLGYLFMANFLGALVAAYGIYRQKIWGWILGFAIAAGAIGGYIWSRTTGLPGLEAEAWLNPWGVVSLVVEGLFILLVLTRPWRDSPVLRPGSSPRQLERYLLPIAGLLVLVMINYATMQLSELYPDADHEHILTINEVQRNPVISQKTLEQEYGMQVSLVAVSMMDSIVDVRIKILDAEKAEPLLEEPSALLVNDKLIPAPHMHRHALKEDMPIIIFYPNRQNTIKSGTPVSLVIGDIRLEDIMAQ